MQRSHIRWSEASYHSVWVLMIESNPTLNSGWRRLGLILGAVAVIALSARLSVTIPGSSVPQSAQTLAVLLVGSLLGSRYGTLSALAYLFAGGFGLPVFADGAAGWSHLVGPTSGYLIAFVLAAGAVGWFTEHGQAQRAFTAFAMMLFGHLLILTLGWLRLSWALGPGPAYHAGVEPFVIGGIVKSILAATIAFTASRFYLEGQPSEPD